MEALGGLAYFLDGVCRDGVCTVRVGLACIDDAADIDHLGGEEVSRERFCLWAMMIGMQTHNGRQLGIQIMSWVTSLAGLAGAVCLAVHRVLNLDRPKRPSWQRWLRSDGEAEVIETPASHAAR